MGKFNDFLNSSLGGQLTGGIMGMALQGWNDKRQLSQQQKLHEMQLAYEQRMGRFNKEMSLQMWKDTSYPAQMEMMKKAGLNPALMYGMGGGGGQSTNTGGSGHGSGGNAPVGGQEIQAMAGMGIQAGMMEAQKKLIEAQAENLKADTQTKLGVDTDKKRSEIANLTASTGNTEADTKLKQIEARILRIDEWVKNRSKKDAADIIMWEANKQIEIVRGLERENQVNNQTKEDRINIVKQEYIGKLLENALTREVTEKTKAEIPKIKMEIQKMAADIIQRQQEINIKTFEAEVRANYPAIWNVAGKVMQNLWNDIDAILGERNLKKMPLSPNNK